MRKQYCALMRQKQKQQDLADHLRNKMQESLFGVVYPFFFNIALFAVKANRANGRPW